MEWKSISTTEEEFTFEKVHANENKAGIPSSHNIEQIIALYVEGPLLK